MAPRDGRIQYRVANIGEVLPAGGKVFTMLDISYVYMDIYLPAPESGKIKVGTEGRILLDAYPDTPIPAKVSFIASQAQFTPKTVETQSERDKLMFRIRVRIDPDRSRDHAASVRSGLPGCRLSSRRPECRLAQKSARLAMNERGRPLPSSTASRRNTVRSKRWMTSRSAYRLIVWSG